MYSNTHLLASKPQTPELQAKFKLVFADVLQRTRVASRALADVLHRLYSYGTAAASHADTSPISCTTLNDAIQAHVSDVQLHVSDAAAHPPQHDVLLTRPFADLHLRTQEDLIDYLPRLLELAHFQGQGGLRAMLDAITVDAVITQTCMACSRASARHDDADRCPFQLLQMTWFTADSGNSFSAALQKFFFTPEFATDYNCANPVHTNDSIDTRRKRQVQRLRSLHQFPPYLVVALQRSTADKFSAKDNRHITFSERAIVRLVSPHGPGETWTYEVVATAVRALL